MLLADSDKFTYPLAEPWAKLLHVVHKKGNYSHIVTASDSFGKNILPRAAALLDVSPITDVIEVSGSHLFVRYLQSNPHGSLANGCLWPGPSLILIPNNLH